MLRAKSSIRIVASDECGPDDLQTESLDPLERFAPGDECRQDDVAERAVLVQERAQHLAGNGDVAQRLGDDRGDEHGLAGEQVELAEEAGRPVADDLVAGGVEDRDLALDDRHEWVVAIADPVEHLADVSGALVAEFGEPGQLRRRQRRAGRRHDRTGYWLWHQACLASST